MKKIVMVMSLLLVFWSGSIHSNNESLDNYIKDLKENKGEDNTKQPPTEKKDSDSWYPDICKVYPESPQCLKFPNNKTKEKK